MSSFGYFRLGNPDWLIPLLYAGLIVYCPTGLKQEEMYAQNH